MDDDEARRRAARILSRMTPDEVRRLVPDPTVAVVHARTGAVAGWGATDIEAEGAALDRGVSVGGDWRREPYVDGMRGRLIES